MANLIWKLNSNWIFYSIGIIVTCWIVITISKPKARQLARLSNHDSYSSSVIIDFESFDNQNVTNSRHLIVPNIVHLIYLNQTKLRFHEMICIYSIYLNQRPDAIFIHCENCTFHGYFWRQVVKVPALRRIIRFNKIPVRRTIFGKTGSWPVHHR